MSRAWMSAADIGREMRYVLRGLRQAPAYCVVVITTLGLAIAVVVAIFSLLNALLLRELPVRDPQSLVQLATVTRTNPDGGFSFRAYEELERQQQTLSPLLAYSNLSVVNLDAGAGLSRAAIWGVTGDLYRHLGLTPVRGRFISSDDVNMQALAPARVVVIGYGLWQRAFGGDESVIGRTVRIEGLPFAVIGIAPQGFTGFGLTLEPDVTIPLTAYPIVNGRDPVSLRTSPAPVIRIGGRLRQGVTQEQAFAQLRTLWPSLREAALPPGQLGAARDQALATSLAMYSLARGSEGFLRTEFTSPLYVLLALALVILLVACANLASVMASRAAGRVHEMALRASLGASRWRLARSPLAEAAVLTTAGACVGAALGYLGGASLADLILKDYVVPTSFDVRADPRVVAFIVGGAMLASVLISLAAARQAARCDAAVVLRAGPRIAGAGRFSAAMVVLQVALSVALVAAAGLLVRTIQAVRAVDHGMTTQGVMVAYPYARPGGYVGVNNDTYYRELLDRIHAIPGVRAASISQMKPAGGGGLVETVTGGSVTTDAHEAFLTSVSPGFFDSLGVPLVAGRDFTWDDDSGGEPVAIVSVSLAYLLGDNILGRRVRIGAQSGRQPVEIVGIVGDTRLYDVKNPNTYATYIPSLQAGPSANGKALIVRGTGVALADIRPAIEAAGREYVSRLDSLEYVIGRTLLKERVTAVLGSYFGGLATLLAAIGLYGLMSLRVRQRRTEIAIRIAVGAPPRQVARTIVRNGMLLTVVGVLLGLGASLFATSLLDDLLFGVEPQDPVALVSSVAVLLLASVLASALPAARAARIDPAIVFRS